MCGYPGRRVAQARHAAVEDVIALVARQGVQTGVSVDGVRAWAARHVVVAGAAPQIHPCRVVSARDRVVSVITEDVVASISALDRVVLALAEDRVAAVAAEDGVTAGFPDDLVALGAAGCLLVAAEDPIRAGAAVDRVRPFVRGSDAAVAAVAPELVVVESTVELVPPTGAVEDVLSDASFEPGEVAR